VKIAINLLVEMDNTQLEGFAIEYGLDANNQKEIREMVRTFLFNDARSLPAAEFWDMSLKENQ